MSDRQHASSGSPFEHIIGFSRAVRVGPIIVVGGTAPIGADGKTVGIGDPMVQARRCFEIADMALRELGSGLANVIRTRCLLTRIEDWEAVAKVHGELFGEVRPVSTILQVTRFIDADWLVETEVDAVMPD